MEGSFRSGTRAIFCMSEIAAAPPTDPEPSASAWLNTCPAKARRASLSSRRPRAQASAAAGCASVTEPADFSAADFSAAAFSAAAVSAAAFSAAAFSAAASSAAAFSAAAAALVAADLSAAAFSAAAAAGARASASLRRTISSAVLLSCSVPAWLRMPSYSLAASSAAGPPSLSAMFAAEMRAGIAPLSVCDATNSTRASRAFPSPLDTCPAS